MTKNTDSLEEALEICEELASKSDKYLFRGQAGLWPVKSTLGRLGSNPETIALEEALIERYAQFMESNNELVSLRKDIDSFFAIAQHYGLKTNYIDFTTDPKIAAFFATHSKNLNIGDSCMLIYFNTEELNDYTDFLKKSKIIPSEEDTFPEIVDINVDNLWRLQAQKGKFLYSPFINIDDIYSNSFNKIIFPFKESYLGLSENQIYPIEKSRLEVLLDQFFFLEEKRKSTKRWLEFMQETKTPVHRAEFTNEDIDTHSSWTTNTSQVRIIEEWDEVLTDKINVIRLSDSIEIEEAIEKVKPLVNSISRKKNYNWEIYQRDQKLKVSKFVNSTWHGLRNQEFPDSYIITCLSNLIFYGVHFQEKILEQDTYINWKMEFKKLIPDLEEMEFTDSDGSYSRSYASKKSMFSCLRHDITNYFPNISANSLTQLFLRNHNPRQLFVRDKFEKCFIEEVLPIQKIIQHNSVFYYNINELTVFGLA